MNELINVTVNIYFKVHDSEIWGGQGSVGYTKISYNECRNIRLDNLNDDFINRQIETVANATGVDKSCVYLISKADYEVNSEETQ